jgi:hypothetical protein
MAGRVLRVSTTTSERCQEDADLQRAVDWLRARVQVLAGGGAHGDPPVVGGVGAPDRNVA